MTYDQPQAGDEQYISTFFCRALYDYQTNDSSSLSFHKGDIIEVLTRLESGWWDGLLNEERGWFPSNYVTVISDQEAEAALNGSEYPSSQASARGRNPAHTRPVGSVREPRPSRARVSWAGTPARRKR